MARTYCFDGLAGQTHQYGGLSAGNLASLASRGTLGNPKAAALQGLQKMRVVKDLGGLQAVLPPQPRPDVAMLRRLGFSGDDARVLYEAGRSEPELLLRCSSASAMWTANAATVAPSADSSDARVHLTIANLSSMFHRALEAKTTHAVFERIFGAERHFVVHPPLPGGASLGDEGAANHTRLATADGTVHLFGWGRPAWDQAPAPRHHPARQALEASRSVARNHGLSTALFWQQAPEGIDAGAFHSDVLAVGEGGFFMLHELSFSDLSGLLTTLSAKLGPAFRYCLAREAELGVADAVVAYPFNSQLIELKSGKLAILAPREAAETAPARRFLERVVAEENPVAALHFLDVNASMKNGGGPACLRLRVPLTDQERGALGGRVLLDDALLDDLENWVERHYRDRLTRDDLSDPALLDEVHTALDELTRILELGNVYDFQLMADS